MVKKLLLMTLFAATLFLSILISTSVRGDLTIIRVPSDYPTIQQAINAASAGSMILVNTGVYHECVVVNKTLQIIGADKTNTILSGSTDGPVVKVTANDVLINGFTIRNSSGSGFYWSGGLRLIRTRNCTISDNIITSNLFYGVFLDLSDSNTILGNIITLNGFNVDHAEVFGDGIYLQNSSNNRISDNIIAKNLRDGTVLDCSLHNAIEGNMFEDNEFGIFPSHSVGTTIHNNTFIGNVYQIGNSTFNGVSENYWDDYAGLDDGSNGRTAGDGTGDTDLPHAYGADNYPLVRPPKPIPILWENTPHPVELASNSTISKFNFQQTNKKIALTVTGPSGSLGYCNVTIPKDLLRGSPWIVKLNNTDITAQTSMTENQTHSFIYFTYNHSTHNVQIIATWVIPEFNEHIILILALILTAFTSVLKRKQTQNKRF